jgi:hypothetical protein
MITSKIFSAEQWISASDGFRSSLTPRSRDTWPVQQQIALFCKTHAAERWTLDGVHNGYVSGKQGTFTPLGCPASPGSMW